MWLVIACGLCGLLVGSFLNVVIARVPDGRSVVHPPSACPGCHTAIAWYDNIPVVSWLLLRGKCRGCSQPISPLYPAVELVTAAAWATVAAVHSLTWWTAALLCFAAITVALTVIDLQHFRLPDAIVFPSYPVAAVLVSASAFLDPGAGGWSTALRALLAGLAMFTAFMVIHLIKPNGMGRGDVKLAGVLGLYLGYVSWGTVVVGFFAGFFAGALISVPMMLAGRAGRKTAIPFGPFLLCGTWFALYAAQPMLTWYLAFLTQ